MKLVNSTAQAKAIYASAQKAWETGQQHYTPLLDSAQLNFSRSGAGAVWGEALDAITAAGWKLHTWAVTMDKKGNPAAAPLFTR